MMNQVASLRQRSRIIVSAMVLSIVLLGCKKEFQDVESNLQPEELLGQEKLMVSSLATITVSPGQTTANVPNSFVGLSLPTSELKQYIGYTSNNSTFINLLGLLNTKGYPSLRICGNNNAWWNPTNSPTPSIITYTIQQSWITRLQSFWAATAMPTLVGVNLSVYDTTRAKSFAQAVVNGAPSGQYIGFEIGNEPDLYVSKGTRPSTYTYANFVSEFQGVATAVKNGTGKPIAGPAFAGSSWNVDNFVTSNTSLLSVATRHKYPCGSATASSTSSSYPTITKLLSNTCSYNVATSCATTVNAGAPYNIGFRLGEVNSVSLGGKAGVSDVFAAALWSADMMYELVKVGCKGVNFQSSGDEVYSPISFSPSVTTNVLVRPIYYGLWLFAKSVQNNGNMVSTTVSTSYNVRAYTMKDASGKLRVVVINKDQNTGGNVTINVPGYSGTGSLELLTAPSLTSTSGVTFGGLTLDNTTNGLPTGTASATTVTPSASNYTISVPVGSAALLTINP